MIFLPVIPPHYYYAIGLSYAHFVEGSVAVKMDAYRNAYRLVSRLGGFILIDNGAAEVSRVHQNSMDVTHEREAPDFKYILAAAEDIGASEIILPDRKMDKIWTVKQTLEAAPLVPVKKRAIVPQGTTWKEWKDCLLELADHMEFHTICVTKDYETLEGGRPVALQFIESLGWHEKYDVHMLGIKAEKMDIKSEVLRIAKGFPWVRSLDSGAPIAFAQHDVRIEDFTIRFSMKWDVLDGKSWLVKNNINMLQAWCLGEER